MDTWPPRMPLPPYTIGEPRFVLRRKEKALLGLANSAACATPRMCRPWSRWAWRVADGVDGVPECHSNAGEAIAANSETEVGHCRILPPLAGLTKPHQDLERQTTHCASLRKKHRTLWDI